MVSLFRQAGVTAGQGNARRRWPGMLTRSLPDERANSRSLTSAERRIAAFSLLGVAYVAFALFARTHALPVLCPFRRIPGWRCPLCGLTTSLGRLLRGEIGSAFRAHPLGPPIVVAGVIWYLASLGFIVRARVSRRRGHERGS